MEENIGADDDGVTDSKRAKKDGKSQTRVILKSTFKLYIINNTYICINS